MDMKVWRSATPGLPHNLIRNKIMKSDPVLSSRSSQGEIQSQEHEDEEHESQQADINLAAFQSQINTDDNKSSKSLERDDEDESEKLDEVPAEPEV